MFKPNQRVTFQNNQRVIFHLIVIKSDENFTTVKFDARSKDYPTTVFETKHLSVGE
tara:strand:- start:160 stop:327 length:168 start_codon:yes stop_codon:yes gene_type:complete